jgi:hypothetical protein
MIEVAQSALSSLLPLEIPQSNLRTTCLSFGYIQISRANQNMLTAGL